MLNSPKTVYFSDLVSDMCNQLDWQIGLIMVFILGYFLLKIIIIPMSKKGIQSSKLLKNFDSIIFKGFDHLLSFGETGALFGIHYIIYLLWIQGLISRNLLYIIITLYAFVLLTAISLIVEYLRERAKNREFKF